MFLDHKSIIGKKWNSIIESTNEVEASFINLTDKEIKQKIESLKVKDHLNEYDFIIALSIFREVVKRKKNIRVYDVQLQGAMALYHGMIAEMKTGEGKTLTACCAAFLAWISNHKVHIITTNDYLASRDSIYLDSIYRYIGMSNGLITHDMNPGERQISYSCDVVFITNKELGFDYLKDNMKRDYDELIFPPLDFCIIDEADSILIDDATTPLVISGNVAITSDIAEHLYKLVGDMDSENFEIDVSKKRALITDDGVSYIESKLENWDNLESQSIYEPQNAQILNMVHQCIKAKYLFQRDVDYIVRDEKIMIIDHNTGRIAADRRYSDSLHQALEAKEGLTVNPDQITLASISYQTFFKLYKKISGMTGTIVSDADEIISTYDTHVVEIPTNKPLNRMDYEDQLFINIDEKENAIIKLVQSKYENLQPVIIGTPDIFVSERLSKKLSEQEIPHVVLNAKFPEKEADIIAQAGRLGSITIATNIAGRGTDILLGGNPDFIYDSEYDSDETYEVIKNKCLDEKRDVISLGGLCVIGWTRNESRRIDNQLIGRAGRQGDPGESVFFLSLDDKIFESLEDKKIMKLRDLIGKSQNYVSHKWISKSIQQSQFLIEGVNSQIRQELLKYDRIIQDQRKIVYDNRLQILSSNSIEEIVQGILRDAVKLVLFPHMSKNSSIHMLNHDLIIETCYINWSLPKVIIEKILENSSSRQEVVTKITDKLSEKVLESMRNDRGIPNIEKVYKSRILEIFDEYWSAHIRLMDSIKKSIGLSAYASLTPIIEYQKTAFDLYHIMIKKVKIEVSQIFSNLEDSL